MFGLFKKRVDPIALEAAALMAGEKLLENIACHRRLSHSDPLQEQVEETINCSVEAQMFGVSISITLLHYTLQDAYYDAGLCGPFDPMPNVKLRSEELRAALQSVWSFVKHPSLRMNIDMRYRYIHVNKLCSRLEQELWKDMEAWSEVEVRRTFEEKRQLSTGWLDFCDFLQNKNPQAAIDLLSQVRSLQ